jgi:hypothetical protein
MKEEEKYPKDFQAFLSQFPDEKSCWQYLIDVRWSAGYVCTKCQSNKYRLTAKHKIHCSDCDTEFSVTSGTIFQESKKSLLLWFHIMWWVVAQKTGTSASNLKDFMGFGSYETAWQWLHKLRRALVKRWINGTHQGKISAKYLEYYLDEFAFRFNRKLSTHRGKLFYRLIQQSVATLPIFYEEIKK